MMLAEWVTTIQDFGKILEFLVKYIGIPISLIKVYQEYVKSRQSRELKTYQSLKSEYVDFLKLCMQHQNIMPYQDLTPNADLSPEERSQRLYILEVLVSLFESAYYQYGQDHRTEFRDRQWKGWLSYMKWWATQEPFRDAWNNWRLKSTDTNTQFDAHFERFMNELVNPVGESVNQFPGAV